MTYLWIALTYILTITTHYICTSNTRKMRSYNEEIKPNDQSIFFNLECSNISCCCAYRNRK